MPRKDFRQSVNDPFTGEEDPAANTWIQTDSQIFGDLAAIDAQVERIRKVDIFTIFPDLTQPRRAIPSAARRTWDGTPGGVAEMFRVWWGLAQQERGCEFDLAAYLQQGAVESDTEAETAGPIETAFLTIVNLAASIRRDGLTNPITVAPLDNHYRLETGERRWLAFHLLAWIEGHQNPAEPSHWLKIPARIVDKIDVWRQASENNARANLNAIGRARQWAVLMMDLNGRENFPSLDTFAHERLYYAQAIDLRPPYGKGEQLLNAMGVSSRSALARYRALLTLPEEIWQGGDDWNLPEETLYALAQTAKTDPNQATAQFRRIVLGRNIVTPSVSATPTEEMDALDFAPGTKRHFARLARAVRKAGRNKHRYNAEALKSLRELRDWLDEQEARIMGYMD